MKSSFIGKNLEITPAIKSYTEEKLHRLTKREPNLVIAFTFSVENVTQIAEATFHYHGTDLHAKATSSNLYAAIDELMDKLLTLLTKQKEKLSDHHG